MGHRACLQGSESRTNQNVKKSCDFLYVRALVRVLNTRKFMRSKNVQCNTAE